MKEKKLSPSLTGSSAIIISEMESEYVYESQSVAHVIKEGGYN